MVFDESLIEKLVYLKPTWVIDIQNKQYVPSSTSIINALIPVKKPSTRGDVYFSKTQSYKIKCLVEDCSIASLLTSTMLGPNTDFVPIKITATVLDSKYVILANLTNYVQTQNHIEMNLVVVDVLT